MEAGCLCAFSELKRYSSNQFGGGEGVKKPQRRDKMKRCLLLKYKGKTKQENLNRMFMRKELASETTGLLKMSLNTKPGEKYVLLGPSQTSLRGVPLSWCQNIFFPLPDRLLPN